MTIKEAIKDFENQNKILQRINTTGSAETIERNMLAIKALKQEPLLDKIRAEIEAKCCITVGRENDPAITLYNVFEIIDKYKAEMEVNE